MLSAEAKKFMEKAMGMLLSKLDNLYIYTIVRRSNRLILPAE